MEIGGFDQVGFWVFDENLKGLFIGKEIQISMKT